MEKLTVFPRSLKPRSQEGLVDGDFRFKTPTPRVYRPLEAEYEWLNAQTLTESMRKLLVRDVCLTKVNRYGDALPFAHNLVALSDSGAVDAANYINASLIEHPFAEARQRFIASQAPLPLTMETFCRMLTRYGVEQIVAIVGRREEPSQFYNYWEKEVNCGVYSLSVLEKGECTALYQTTKLEVVERESGRRHAITHIHIFEWRDRVGIGLESIGALVELLKLVGVRQRTANVPIVVHCSAGVGRTMSFICAFYVIDQRKRSVDGRKRQRFSVKQLVAGLRQQRYNAVNTLKQYTFLHEMAYFVEDESGE